MSVEFCPDCGTLLRKQKLDDGKIYLVCKKCGFKKPYNNATQKGSKKSRNRNLIKKTVIIEKEQGPVNPVTTVECPECGHNKAEYFQLQTRSADEPATTFYRCLKCGKVWRAY
ncbi:MAG: transcription factor S [Promethearchaeota archaeon]